MDCKRYKTRRYKTWLSDAAAGALDAAREAELRAHVERCSDCRAALERERTLFEAIDGGIRAHLAAAPSPEFAARLRMRLAEEAARPSRYGLDASSRLGTWLAPRFWPRFALATSVPAAAAALLAFAVLTVWLARRPASHRATSPQAVAQKDAASRERPSAVRSQAHEAQTTRVAPIPERASALQTPNSTSGHSASLRRLPGGRGNSGGASRPEVLPQVLVDKNEQESLAKLYESIQNGRVDVASLAAVPPGFERQPDGSLVPVPLKIPPLEIAKLDSGQVWGGQPQ